MNLLDNIIGVFSPEAACRRAFYREELDAYKRSNYDAGGHERLNANWGAHIESAEMTDRTSRDTIRARARDLERNSDILNSIVSAYTRNIVGAGFNLQSKTSNEDLNDQLETLWRQWTRAKNCDVTGQQSFNQLLRMAVRRKKIDGGILFKKCYTAGGLVPFKLQALEVDELSLSWSTPKAKGNRVVGGIEFDPYNRPVGYWISQYSLDGMEIATPTYYEAKDIIFLYSKRRPSQAREMSDVSQTLTRIRDANQFIEAISVKERIAACLSVFVRKTVPAGGFGRNTVQNSNGGMDYAGKRLAPGMITEMNAGDDIQVVDPKSSATDATSFLKLQQKLIASGQGLSYEATARDMSETNYSSARQGMIEDEMTYLEDVEMLKDKFMTEVYESFVISCVLAGLVDAPDFWENKADYLAHIWVSSPKRWIDPQKEANANQIALATGQKTFPQIAAENGRDWREQIDELAEAQAYAQAKGVKIGGMENGTGNTGSQSSSTDGADGDQGDDDGADEDGTTEDTANE